MTVRNVDWYGVATAEIVSETAEVAEVEAGKSSDGRSKRSFTPGASDKGPIVRTLLLLGISAVAAAAATETFAQETQLPPLTVEGAKTASKKKAAAKKAPSAAPAVVQQQPAPQPVSSTAAAAVASEMPYTVPAGVSVITEGELSTFGASNLDNALRSQPGTFTRISPQNPGIALNIRGFEGSGRVNTTIDGARQNFRFTGHEAQGFTYIDSSLIASVEIERGAVSTAGGAGALAGAANLRTLDVQDILLPGQTVGALTSTTWGSNNQRFTGLAAAAAQSAGVGVAGAVGRRNPSNYENAEGVTVPLTFQDLYSGLFKANFQINEENSLRFGGVFYNNDFFANSYYQNVISNTFTAKYAYNPIGNDLIDFKLNGYRNEVKMKYGRNAAGAWTTTSGRVMEDNGWGFDASNVSRFAIGSVRVRSEYGYEYFFDDVDAYNTLNPSQAGGVNPSGKSSIGGIFSETTFSQSIFDLIVGLRYDMYNITGNGSIAPLPNNPNNGQPQPLPPFLSPGPYQVDKSEERLNPKVTLAAQVLPWLQPYVTYSQSSRAPTVAELLTGGVHPGAGSAVSVLPNPFLDPEIQKGWEFGANIRKDGVVNARDSFRLKADYYTMDVENYIASCGAPYIGPRGPSSVNYFCNVAGTSQVQGVELQSMYDTGFAFAGLSYTYTHTNLPSQTDGLGAHTYVPEHVIVGTLGVRLLNEKLTVGTRVSYFSESYVGDVNVGSFYTEPYMPAYTVVDLFSNYKFNDNLQLALNVDNLFDESYSPALSTTQGFPGSPTCFGSNAPGCNTTGMGRTVYATVKAQF